MHRGSIEYRLAVRQLRKNANTSAIKSSVYDPDGTPHKNYNYDALPGDIKAAIDRGYIPKGRDNRYYSNPTIVAKARAKLAQHAWSTAQTNTDTTTDYIEQRRRESLHAPMPPHIQKLQGIEREEAEIFEMLRRKSEFNRLKAKSKQETYNANRSIVDSNSAGYLPAQFNVYRADEYGNYGYGARGNRNDARTSEGLEVYARTYDQELDRAYDAQESAAAAAADAKAKAAREAESARNIAAFKNKTKATNDLRQSTLNSAQTIY